jgi:polyphosphate glucokinase
MIGFGIDIGGTGIKGAPVNLETGELVADRFRIPTPKPATPAAVAEVAREIVANRGALVDEAATIGVAIPAIVQHGIARSAANIDPAWVDCDVDALFTEVLGRDVQVFNDADAAGVAEARFGAALGNPGVTLLVTLGTGIGTALLHHGELVPNSEFGHLLVDVEGQPRIAEHWAATSVKEKGALSWEAWAERLQGYFTLLERLISPDLFVVGGGVSKRSESFLPLLNLKTPIVPATHRNNAGIIGAAVAVGGE